MISKVDLKLKCQETKNIPPPKQLSRDSPSNRCDADNNTFICQMSMKLPTMFSKIHMKILIKKVENITETKMLSKLDLGPKQLLQYINWTKCLLLKINKVLK